ncbi:MAG: hypothetical protein WCG61_03675 [Chlorobium sp.]
MLETLEQWQKLLAFPRLREYGMAPEDVDSIVCATRSKSNAVQLDNAAMKRILIRRWWHKSRSVSVHPDDDT